VSAISRRVTLWVIHGLPRHRAGRATGQVRVHLSYVSQLTDARATLDERCRLLVVGGLLGLLAATLHIDLAWVGDPAAEDYAREIIARLYGNGDANRWPRRVASANIDLALALLTTDRLDEAAASALAAILSGMVVPSNHWRALEIVRSIEGRGLPEGPELRDAYEQLGQIFADLAVSGDRDHEPASQTSPRRGWLPLKIRRRQSFDAQLGPRVAVQL